MTRSQFEAALEELAAQLEAAVPLATTRIEHIRVTAQALEARRLARVFREAGAHAA